MDKDEYEHLGILVNPMPHDYPKDGKIELVRNGQFVNINSYLFCRKKENSNE